MQDTKFIWGRHYIPHDAEHRDIKTGKSVQEMLGELLPGADIVIVERVQDVLIGINQVRDIFPTVWMDAEGCADGLVAMENYRKEYNEKVGAWREHPLHDWSSNYADAFRQFAQGFTVATSQYKRAAQRSWRTR